MLCFLNQSPDSRTGTVEWDMKDHINVAETETLLLCTQDGLNISQAR